MKQRMLGHAIYFGKCWCVCCRYPVTRRDFRREKRRERQAWKREVRNA